MATKLTKGTSAYLFGVWSDERCVVSVQAITIQSMGKKQGTYTVDGVPGLSRLYSHLVERDVIAAEECPDPLAEALRRAEALKVQRIAHYQSRQTQWPDSSPAFVQAMKDAEERTKAAAPSAGWFSELRAAFLAK